MYSKDDIAKLLAEGKTSDEIAAEFTNALNAAIKDNESKSRKVTVLAAILEDVKDYIDEFYPSFSGVFKEDISAADVVKGLDELEASVSPMLNYFKKELDGKKKNSSALEDFLEEFGLK